MSRFALATMLLLAIGVAWAEDEPRDESAPGVSEAQAQAEPEKDAPAKEEPEKAAKEISGMSILGNQEAPKSLVIVPWKSSKIGESLGISTMLDDSRLPVDKEVFLRALSYYEIRSKKTP